METPASSIRFGYTQLESVVQKADAGKELAVQLQLRKSEKVFLIVSNTLNSNTDVITGITARLGTKVAGIFDEIPAHTPRKSVIKAVVAARAAGADLLVTVGGGSVIDAAKTVQLAINQGINTEEELIEYAQFADGSRGPKAGDFSLINKQAGLRQIAIPTTLSGAEFSYNAGVTDTVKALKEGYRAPALCPVSIIYDPAIALHTPQWLWLSTAIRSLDHAIEGYCSKDAHSYLDAHFLHGLRLFASSLPQTMHNPNDLDARSLSQQAVWLACCGLGRVAHGASHGIGYLLGAVCGVPHGLTSCVMLPAVLEFNVSENEIRQRAIAAALGAPELTAGQAVRALVRRLKLPASLQEVGVKQEQLTTIAELSCRHPVVRNNPKAIESSSQVMEILQLAWEAQS